MQRVDNRIRHRELGYAKFMAKRNYYSSVVQPSEFKRMLSHVSIGLVYYDPNFDFRPGFDPLMHAVAGRQPCMAPYQPVAPHYEVRYHP